MAGKIERTLWFRAFLIYSVVSVGSWSIILEVVAIVLGWEWGEYLNALLAALLVVLPSTALATAPFIRLVHRKVGER